jgi:hypothetical protein
MGVSVLMNAAQAPVPAGQRVTSDIRVRNTGAVVDQVVLDIVGEPAAWARVEPSSINLMPGQEQTAQIIFEPPRSSHVRSGQFTFALRAMSQEDTAGSVVEEGTVEVGAFSQMGGELVPRTSTGSRAGRHELALDNFGNHPETVSVTATDPDLKLDYRINPANLVLEPGSTTFIKVKAKPRRTYWRGPNRTIPFQVSAVPAEGPPVMLPASMVQTAKLPPWIFKALALALVALIAFLILWFTLFKPTVEATAREVAVDHTKELADAINQADQKAAEAAGSAAGAQEKADSASENAAAADKKAAAADKSAAGAKKSVDKITSEGGGSPATTLNQKQATDFRITTDVPPGESKDAKGPDIPEKKVLWISDLVLQNPNGDTGTLRIQRGDGVLLVFGLANFRDLDYHFIQPAQFDAKSPVVVSVSCKNPKDNCSPSVYFSGQFASKAQPKTSASPTPAD